MNEEKETKKSMIAITLVGGLLAGAGLAAAALVVAGRRKEGMDASLGILLKQCDQAASRLESRISA